MSIILSYRLHRQAAGLKAPQNCEATADVNASQQLLNCTREIRVIFCFGCVILFHWFPRRAAGRRWVEG
jgi:hypothetical protein